MSSECIYSNCVGLDVLFSTSTNTGSCPDEKLLKIPLFGLFSLIHFKRV